MAEHTFVDWRNFVRDICAEHFLRNPVRIGGVGVEVQIDECVRPQKTQRRTTTSAAALGVLQRTAVTLLPIVQQFIRSGTTVVSDLWTAYNTIGNIGY